MPGSDSSTDNSTDNDRSGSCDSGELVAVAERRPTIYVGSNVDLRCNGFRIVLAIGACNVYVRGDCNVVLAPVDPQSQQMPFSPRDNTRQSSVGGDISMHGRGNRWYPADCIDARESVHGIDNRALAPSEAEALGNGADGAYPFEQLELSTRVDGDRVYAVAVDGIVVSVHDGALHVAGSRRNAWGDGRPLFVNNNFIYDYESRRLVCKPGDVATFNALYATQRRRSLPAQPSQAAAATS